MGALEVFIILANIVNYISFILYLYKCYTNKIIGLCSSANRTEYSVRVTDLAWEMQKWLKNAEYIECVN